MKTSTTLAEVIDALDNVTASLETVMAHYGADWPKGDRIGRECVVAEARKLIERNTP